MSDVDVQKFKHADIILKLRRLIRTNIILMVSIMLSTSATYLILIKDIFQPADLTNPAIYQFATSDDFHKNTRPFFDQLQRYNAGLESSLPAEEFYAVDPSHFGVTIAIHYQLQPQDPAMKAAQPDSDGRVTPGFRYTPQFSLTLNVASLVVYLLFEGLLICLVLYMCFRRKSAQERAFEDRIIKDFFDSLYPMTSTQIGESKLLDQLSLLLTRFGAFCIQLNKRHGNRDGIMVNDEYDMQDLLHAILTLHFDDIRAEEFSPSYAGGNSRIDFLLHDEMIAIETKMTRKNLRDRELGEELIVDIHRYAIHPTVNRLICLIWDPEHLIGNPAGLRNDLARQQQEIAVDVIIVPRR